MLRTATAAFVLLFASHIEAVAQTQAPPPLSVRSFTRNPAIWSPRLSPDGRFVAAIQETSRGEELIIIDWRTG